YTWLTALVRVEALLDAGRADEAEAVAAEAITAIGRLPEDDYAEVYMANVIGRLRHQQGRIDEAIEQRRAGLGGLLAMYDVAHAEVQQARVSLASSLVATGGDAERAEALRLVEEARAVLTGKDDPDAAAMLGAALLERGRVRAVQGDFDGARADAADALARLQLRPEDAPRLREARAFARTLPGGR